MAKELTTRAIESAKAPKAGKTELKDSRVPGFGLRITARGVRTWTVVTRIDGAQVRRTIGHSPAMSLADARALAGQVKDAARQGRDLLAEEQAERDDTKAALAARKTVGEVCEDYFKRKVAALRRGNDIRAVIERELLPQWRDRPIEAITPLDVLAVTDRLLDAGKPSAANKAFEVMRGLFNWAIKSRRYDLDRAPTDRMDAPAAKVIRDRVLSDSELRDLWAVEHGYPFGPFLHMLMVLGQRRDEIAGMQWSEIGETDGTPIWTIPVERCKSKRPHIVPLPPQAVTILESLPRFVGPYVFSTMGGMRPISGYSKFKACLPGLGSPWRLHDIRRTMRTGLARLGVVDVVAERAINHAPKGLSAVYDQWGYLPEKRHALNLWASHLEALVNPTDDKVVRFPKAG